MGRSSLQGIAWHYEYAHRKSRKKRRDPDVVSVRKLPKIKKKDPRMAIEENAQMEKDRILDLHKKYGVYLGKKLYNEEYGIGTAVRIEGERMVVQFSNEESYFRLPYAFVTKKLIQVEVKDEKDT